MVLLICSVGAVAQDLNAYLKIAAENSAEIKSFELRYDIAKEEVNAAEALPDTEFSAGYFVSTPETRVGPQQARFSVRQMLPWFGTLAARTNYQDAVAEAKYVDYLIAKRKLNLEVARHYYELYAISAKLKVVRQNLQLVDTYKTLALTSVEVDRASAVDVLKLEMRQNELQSQLKILEESKQSAEIQFNAILNVSDTEEVTVVDSLFLPEEDLSVSTAALNDNPEVLKYDKLYESIAQSELVNQRESGPKLGVGLDYLPVGLRTDMDLADNGKDIVMPMVSVSVAIFNSKYKSVTRQNQLRQQEVISQKTQRLNLLKSFFAEAVKNRNAARINYTTQQQNLEYAREAEEILRKSYETGTIDFSDVLDIQELQLDFQMKLIEALQQYFEQSARINYLVN